MTYSTKAGPRDYGQMFLVLGHIVVVAFALMLLAGLDILDRGFGVIGTVFGVLAIMIMHRTRHGDEWLASLWMAGANAGFIAAVAWLLLLPMAEGFFDGLTGLSSRQDLPAETASIVAVGAFLAAFYLKRIRGH